jgi:hypothetical protein
MDFEPNCQKEKDQDQEFEKKERNYTKQTIRSFRELADAISVHSSKMFSVPFLRTQETTLRIVCFVI